MPEREETISVRVELGRLDYVNQLINVLSDVDRAYNALYFFFDLTRDFEDAHRSWRRYWPDWPPIPSFPPFLPRPKRATQAIGEIEDFSTYVYPGVLARCRELRENATDAEALLWSLVRDRQLGNAKFRRQHSIRPYILDFYCHEARLAIEIDGGQHAEDERTRRDLERTKFLEEQGITVLRFCNNDVLKNTEAVLERILAVLIPLTPALSRGERGKNCARVEFEIFEPTSESQVQGGTVTRAKATCLCCNAVLSPDRVRAQLREQRGGADVIFDKKGERVGGARLLAVVTLKPGEQGRHYRLSVERDYQVTRRAMKALEKVATTKLPNGLNPVPDEPLPPQGTLGFRVQLYGMTQWGDLFTARQKVALVTLARQVSWLSEKNGEKNALKIGFALALSRCADRNSNLTRWDVSSDNIGSTFSRQALPIVWDFAEVAPLGGASGDWEGMIDWIARVAETFSDTSPGAGQFQLTDASVSPLPDETVSLWFTDPPYYDAVPYADLSDFFFVWLKRALLGYSLLRDPFDPMNPLTPKRREVVQDETKCDNGCPKDRTWFEETMAKAFAEGRRVLREDGIGSVVFAHKTTEGWEALLSGLIRGGWTITGSWPIATEMGSRLRARDSAALATSVHLVCRPRPHPALSRRERAG